MIQFNIDPKLKLRTAGELLANPPMTILVNKFNEESAKIFRDDFDKAVNTGQHIIPIVIDSFGGVVYSLLSMIDTIKSSPVPVATIATGKTMSCGQFLLTFGTEGLRFMAPTATVMMHDVSGGTYGKIEEIKADVKEAERLHRTIFTMCARNCGKPDNYFLDMMEKNHHADVFLDAEECKKHNIIQHIRVPNFSVDVSVKYSFE
jgi:ATP-dependent Clp protease, protease subunit